MKSPKPMLVHGDRQQDYKFSYRYGLPYILNENDVASLRGNDIGEELEMIEDASTILFTSEVLRKKMETMYDMADSHVVHLRPLRKDLDFDKKKPRFSGKNAVFAGGLFADDDDDAYSYRKYTDIFSRIIDSGWNLHLYSSSFSKNDVIRAYSDIGCHVHGHVQEADLYRELSQYDVGLQAFAKPGVSDYVQYAVPNKTWLYLAAGIPTLGINSHVSHIYEGKWGISSNESDLSSKDLGSLLDNATSMKITDDMRYSEVIDNDIDTFRSMLKSVGIDS